MINKKLIIGISALLIVFGLIFTFLPHDLQELVTFGANIPHFLHLVMGFVIVGTGLACIGYSIKQGTFRIQFPQFEKTRIILNKSKIPLVILIILISGFLVLKYFSKDVEASPEFDKLKEAAKYCTNPISTDPKCTESFAEMRGVMHSSSNDPQRTAQEKIGIVGKYGEDDGFDPMEYLSTWNFNNLPTGERSKYYRETRRPDGSLLREYWIYAEDKEIEIAPGVFFPAWTYNGQVPAPTIRATEGDNIRIYFTNKGTKPHTMHFHGFHNSKMDGAMTEDFVYPGKSFTYEFDADPFGVHLFHCHSVPLKQHISKGLYGAYIVDPKNDTRPKPDKELVMIMNAFDTNLDGGNEVYAVNTKAFYYALNPIKVKKDELVRIYLINIIEFDPINSFHLHANFFDQYRTGTKLEPDAFTDIVSFAQAERSILDVKFKYPGMYMFHAHVSEFTELGWMGFFEVTE
ncbi:MAG: multicopper oxidase domain-containing protein [Nanoarchaeota archaeon]|nr:multicopper oxidase domain-containing protein [Nanoarchaeota archaeon]